MESTCYRTMPYLVAAKAGRGRLTSLVVFSGLSRGQDAGKASWTASVCTEVMLSSGMRFFSPAV